MRHNRGFMADKQILCHHLHTDAVHKTVQLPPVGAVVPSPSPSTEAPHTSYTITNDDRPRKRTDNKFKPELQSL